MIFDTGLIVGILVGGVLSGGILTLVGLRLVALLQQSGYGSKRYLKWYFSHGNIHRKKISLLCLASLLLTALFALCFSFVAYPTTSDILSVGPVPDFRLTNLISAIPFFALAALYLFSEKKYALKVPLKKTSRIVRLCVVFFLVNCAVSIGLGFGLSALAMAIDKAWAYLLQFVPMGLVFLLLPFMLVCANALDSIYEIPHNRAFVRRAAKALEKSTCVKVGITGSFGKTSVKHFAAQMLSDKFRVIATPASFNTPMGIARTVLESGLDCDIFLAEMGARHEGDIRELCNLVRPQIGVITGVCEQHVETFGSLEAIRREKAVLAECAEKVVLGATVREVAAKQAMREGTDFQMRNLSCTQEGISFELSIGESRIPIQCGLLGECAAEDVALVAVLCYLLGMTGEEISAAARMLEPVPHRLQKLEVGGRIILDDSYNSNVEGAKNAINTLKLFDGKKIVVTPGLVELGQLSEELNEALGKALVGIDVILVGETLVLPVRKGYLENGGDEKMLRTVPTLSAAQELLASELSDGGCVLFLNDLPDIYR